MQVDCSEPGYREQLRAKDFSERRHDEPEEMDATVSAGFQKLGILDSADASSGVSTVILSEEDEDDDLS